MTQKVDPVIHDLAVRLASNQLPNGEASGGRGPLSEHAIKKFYANYLVAVKTLSELDRDEDFKANPHGRKSVKNAKTGD